MNGTVVTPLVSNREAPGVLGRGPRYFTAVAGLMLVLNLIGFAPTYFMKGYFGAPELPLRTHVHGVLFSAWFVLYVVQTALVARDRLRLHRRLGVVAGMLGVVMVASGLVMLYERALEVRLTGEGAARSLVGTTLVVWSNLALLIAFSCFAALGIRFRHRPEAHRRLMLLASMSMMLQAIGRIGKFPVLPGSEVLWALGGLLALLGSLVVYDLRGHRRLHPVTMWGPPLLFVTIVLCSLVVPRTDLGQALILALAS